ncbi:MAG: hypothetical protein ABIG95_03590 [Candidatus Woesearchaeota archaeon]
MVDKGFLKILKKFSDEKMVFRKKPYNLYGHCEEHEKQIHQLYFQYKLFKWTKWLVFATWALALVTILLVIFK